MGKKLKIGWLFIFLMFVTHFGYAGDNSYIARGSLGAPPIDQITSYIKEKEPSSSILPHLYTLYLRDPRVEIPDLKDKTDPRWVLRKFQCAKREKLNDYNFFSTNLTYNIQGKCSLQIGISGNIFSIKASNIIDEQEPICQTQFQVERGRGWEEKARPYPGPVYMQSKVQVNSGGRVEEKNSRQEMRASVATFEANKVQLEKTVVAGLTVSDWMKSMTRIEEVCTEGQVYGDDFFLSPTSWDLWNLKKAQMIEAEFSKEFKSHFDIVVK